MEWGLGGGFFPLLGALESPMIRSVDRLLLSCLRRVGRRPPSRLGRRGRTLGMRRVVAHPTRRAPARVRTLDVAFGWVAARYESARVREAAAGVQDADLGLCRGPRRRGAGEGRRGRLHGEEARAPRPRRGGVRSEPLHASRRSGASGVEFQPESADMGGVRSCSRCRRSSATASVQAISAQN